mgnify:CR=1 FL=1
MWKPIYQPEPWPQFVKRKDIIALPLMEQRKKFMQETILFENYLSTLNTVNTVNSSVASSAAAGGGGPLPGGGGTPPGPSDPYVTINTLTSPPNDEWNGNTKTTNEVWMYTNTPGQYWANFSSPTLPVTVDWGDGNVEDVTTYTETATMAYGFNSLILKHVYASDGEYNIAFSGENKYQAKLAWLPLTDISNWDPQLAIASDSNALIGMFMNSSFSDEVLTQLESWNTSGATSLKWLFQNSNPLSDIPLTFFSSSFNPDISSWDVSSVISLDRMLMAQPNFSQDLSSWDTSNVNYFWQAFLGCSNLISGSRADLWDVSGANFSNSFQQIFGNSMTTVEARGTMPHIGGWNMAGLIGVNPSSLFANTFKGSGFSHTAIGETLIGWAAQGAALPDNVGMGSTPFASTWDGVGFSDPTYSTGSAFGAEVSASYALLTGAPADGSTTTLTVSTGIGKGDQERYTINGTYLNATALVSDFTFLIGNTYRFDQSNAFNVDHPLRFSTTIDGTWGGGVEYTTGVTIVGTPGTAGAYSEITVTGGTTSPLYVYCPSNEGFGLGSLGTPPYPLTMNQAGKGWTIPGLTFN